MRILGIETSCDETAAAVVEDGRRVLCNMIASSSEEFKTTGGVIPEEAARRQVELIRPTIDAALKQSGLSMRDIDAIAVTHAPGLLGSLLVGVITARTMSWVHGKPLIPVHHTLGHLCSTWLGLPEGDEPRFPVLTLSASGGHTDLWLRTSPVRGMLLGRTKDDAAGEAFDKGASLLGLPYPGGPAIAAAGACGDPHAFPFPLPLAGDDSLDWSFSGLKTALRTLLRDHPDALTRLPDVAASYEYAICRHLMDRVNRALDRHPETAELHVVGGVSANTRLRDAVRSTGRAVRVPVSSAYCTDNGAMIASAAFFLHREDPSVAQHPFAASASKELSLA